MSSHSKTYRPLFLLNELFVTTYPFLRVRTIWLINSETTEFFLISENVNSILTIIAPVKN